ncbi:class III poly(R)-hydroxyalkanoic acid synthase subunit PhaC [Ignavigranum ruoffiae]|uniref:Poly(3-hydroxyalkanoate) polymerase subunit PhaC n=1 Tax=Ignavigranum ruoffiae TaxID=89093 RepID=A0A1H9FVU1_9LACT|nr:class III poly(R)-hydroxyalkanoic acid synthase subunit PhaC [Ignavigranum ruoffiae]SEQ42002.1 polyhydroxyalkanoate synthase [Ignavigranum ruoffiae]
MVEDLFRISKQNFQDQLSAQEKLIQGIHTLSNLEMPKGGVSEKEVIYTEDKLTLYHFIPKVKNHLKTPTLISYALVNKYYMLDLQEGNSFIEDLLNAGADLYVIDWGYPTKDDMYNTMEDYIQGYMRNCVEAVLEHAQADKLNFFGICQGATFATIFTALNPQYVKNLVTVVAPIDFSPSDRLLFHWGKEMDADSMVEAYGNIPGDVMNNGFLLLSPVKLTTNKYLDIIDRLDDPKAMTNFLALETWIFDSPDQAGATIKQFTNDLYHDNKLIKGELKIGDQVVDLKNIEQPLLNVIATRDDQVPQKASEPLNKAVSSKDTETVRYESGHIGLFVSRRSRKEMIPKVMEFYKERDE